MKKTVRSKAAKSKDPEAFSHTQLLRLDDETYEAIRAYRAAELRRTSHRPSIAVSAKSLIIAGAKAKAQEQQS